MTQAIEASEVLKQLEKIGTVENPYNSRRFELRSPSSKIFKPYSLAPIRLGLDLWGAMPPQNPIKICLNDLGVDYINNSMRQRILWQRRILQA